MQKRHYKSILQKNFRVPVVDASLRKSKKCNSYPKCGNRTGSKKIVGDVSKREAWIMDALFANRIDDDFNELLQKQNLTLESLKQKAFAKSRLALESLDQMIALKAKTLAGFQASYEGLVNRKVNMERMQLQNALMQRDLGAIANEADNDKVNKSPSDRPIGAMP